MLVVKLHLGSGVGFPKPGTRLKNQIPIRTWADRTEAQPGFREIALVDHKGVSTMPRAHRLRHGRCL